MLTTPVCASRLIILSSIAISVAAQRVHAQADDSVLIANRVADTVCTKEVVLLGELPSHGEARGFFLKSRIVDRLVEQCGFNAVLFEAPMYDFAGFDRSTVTGIATPTQLDSAIGRFWSTRELAPWRRGLFEHATMRRLTLGGLDDQVSITSQYARATLPELIASASVDAAGECRAIANRNLRWLYDERTPFDGEEKERLQRCARKAAERRTTADGSIATPESMMLANFAAYADRQRDPNAPTRDETMFRNTMWYLDRLPRGTKVIIWTASVHAAQQRGELGYIPLGARLAERLGDRIASVGFTALGGQTSMAGMPSRSLPALPSGSLEALSLSDGVSYAVLNQEALRVAGVVPSRLFGRPVSADWSRMFDVVVVVREEVAPTFDR